MSFAFDHLLLARILFTVMTAGYAVATVIADFNATHATNPEWTPHARFHVVWQITSYVGFGLFALVLIWWPGPPVPQERCLEPSLVSGSPPWIMKPLMTR